MVTQAIISDAGVSSRFFPIVKTIPKSMLPIGNKPVVQLLVEECLEAGLKDIVIVCREETKPIFEDYFNNSREDIRQFLEKMGKLERFDSIQQVLDFPEIKFVVQDSTLPYGTASPILAAKEYLREGEPFAYIQGDDLIFTKGDEKKDCQLMVEALEANLNYSGIMMAQEVMPERIHLYGAVKLKQDSEQKKLAGTFAGDLDHIVEKPTKEEAPSFLSSYGRFLYKYEIFNYMNVERIGKDGELWNTDALTAMAAEKPVMVLKNQGNWMTTGDPVHYLQAQNMFAGN